ncbi:hypothetical protein JQ604_24545 [Bradyrhizobium jicamae]|uniref:hypothetical protein n=1 Tax=Bradyrhizobium jicamae TaxID=280332 RepID=UPI001BAB9053|nr:hypothetical protein [Bradyrhizobium jicamae]MBR0755364.1 hypothetical protein [Bradyrhizobium jicamae]
MRVKQLLPQGLALNLWPFAQVLAIEPEKIKGVVKQTILLAAGKRSLQFGKIGPTFVDDDHLPVDDRLTNNVKGAHDEGKPLGPVEPVARV